MHIWKVKLVWRATAITIHVTATDADDAWWKASKKVRRMMGGDGCIDIIVQEQLSVGKGGNPR